MAADGRVRRPPDPVDGDHGRWAALAPACVLDVGAAATRDRTGLAITMCHCPPGTGTSRWNKIELLVVLAHRDELALHPARRPRHDR